MSAGNWIVRRATSGEVHVSPLRDAVDHDDSDCACGPTTEPCEREDGSTGWLITHHSLDGREKHEKPADDGSKP